MALQNTKRDTAERRRMMENVRRLFFLGIGGVHMWALAMMAKARGYVVAGMDRADSERTRHLREAGITVYTQGNAQAAEAVEMTDALIYTLAISPEDPLYRLAVERGIPLFSRADFLGFLMGEATERICVAGCHGKSTTTAWIGQMLRDAARAPTVVCGAEMPAFGSSFSEGDGRLFVAEACEYGDSFLSLSPTLAVVLNVGFDHADYFRDEAAVMTSFARFAADAARILVNADDGKSLAATASAKGAKYSFGLSPTADFRAENLTFSGGTGRFSLILAGKDAGEVALRIPGVHNVYNALAAAGAATLCGLSAGEIRRGLTGFCGIDRRFAYRGRFCGARVFDDYAHHPEEITVTLKTGREMLKNGGRLFAVFQPHTYTRTAAFWNDFCRALREADRVFLVDIYAAREEPLHGINSKKLAEAVGKNATYHADFSELAAVLSRELCPNDLLLVMGAGDIDGIFREFSRKDFTT